LLLLCPQREEKEGELEKREKEIPQLACCLIEVLVDVHVAEALISSVLLHDRSGPAAERSEVRELRLKVPVSNPELETRRPVAPLAKDGLPLNLVGIDTGILAAKDAHGSVGKLVEELTVPVVAAEPVFGALDVDPHLTVVDVLGSVIESLDLATGITAARAGEHVDIDVVHASSPGVVHRGSTVGINSASGHVATDNGKGVAVVADTLPAAHREQLRDINTNSGRNSGHKGEENNKARKRH